jgi:hypothetical protein
MKNIIFILFISLNIFKIHGQGIEKGIKIYIPNLRELFTKEITVNELAKELKLSGYVSNNQNFVSMEKELEFIYNNFKNLEESNRYIYHIPSSGNEDLDWMRFLKYFSNEIRFSTDSKIIGTTFFCLDSLLKFQIKGRESFDIYITKINNLECCENLIFLEWFNEINNDTRKFHLKSHRKADRKLTEYYSAFNYNVDFIEERLIKLKGKNGFEYVFNNGKLESTISIKK